MTAEVVKEWWAERCVWLFFVLSHIDHAHWGWTMSQGKGRKQRKRTCHGICMWWCYAVWINEVTMGLWLLIVLRGDLNNADLPVCWALPFLIPSNQIKFMRTSSLWNKINQYHCSHLILFLNKLHASSLMHVHSRYKSPRYWKSSGAFLG